MKISRNLIVLFFIATAIASNGQSKIANINSTKLLEQIPDLKLIQEEMVALQTKYQESLKQMESEMQKMQIALQQDTSSPKSVLEIKQKQLEDMYGRYQELQQNAQNDLMQQRQEKMTPIIDKSKEAIIAVAKEKGYDYVVDTSEGSGIIYSAPKDDIMLAVKQKLGIE